MINCHKNVNPRCPTCGHQMSKSKQKYYAEFPPSRTCVTCDKCNSFIRRKEPLNIPILRALFFHPMKGLDLLNLQKNLKLMLLIVNRFEKTSKKRLGRFIKIKLISIYACNFEFVHCLRNV